MQPKTTSRYRGPIPPLLWEVLELAWERGIAVQGDYARGVAAEVALAASTGWLSSLAPDGATYTRRWRITQAGLLALQHKELYA